jgi:small multidrug resistance family-3 protein
MTVARSILLFILAALAEVGAARLVWQGWRENHGLLRIAAGVIALRSYGFVATFQPDPNFGRQLADAAGLRSPTPRGLSWNSLVTPRSASP